jgi:hypothetical protein
MANVNIYVLMKNFSKSGLVKFHGVADNLETATTWQNAGTSNWFYEFDVDEGSVITQTPITFEKMNNGEID